LVNLYRLYFVGHDGHFSGVVELSCADDAAAIEAVDEHRDGRPMELWSWTGE
jgi:hypothetical protein